VLLLLRQAAGGLWGLSAALAMASPFARPLPLCSSTRSRAALYRQRGKVFASSGRSVKAASSAVAEATKPLTKADLVAYLASGCKTRDKWRCGVV